MSPLKGSQKVNCELVLNVQMSSDLVLGLVGKGLAESLRKYLKDKQPSQTKHPLLLPHHGPAKRYTQILHKFDMEN